jgi:hypothetical protein
MPDFSKQGPVTIILVLVASIAAIAGAVVTIVHPETLSFNDYLDQLAKFAGALGLLGIGRGIHHAAKESAKRTTPSSIAGQAEWTAPKPTPPPIYMSSDSMNVEQYADSVDPGGDGIDSTVAALVGINPNEVAPDGSDQVHAHV